MAKTGKRIREAQMLEVINTLHMLGWEHIILEDSATGGYDKAFRKVPTPTQLAAIVPYNSDGCRFHYAGSHTTYTSAVIGIPAVLAKIIKFEETPRDNTPD